MSLYTQLFYAPEVQPLLADETVLRHMLAFEAALARAQAKQGLIPAAAAEVIDAVCGAAELDTARLRSEIALGGNAAIPLVKQLTERVRQADPEAARYVHLGATSQDVVDTATVLTIRSLLDWLDAQVGLTEAVLEALTQAHRQTWMAGRTLLQQAKPIPFGLKTALWLDGLRRHRRRLTEGRERWLVLQLAGAVGSRNAWIPVAVVETVAASLGLKPAVSWHTQRDSLVEFGAALGLLTGSLGKIAKDISLLMQTEIAEVLEGKAEGKGGSSTMPHKRNPVTCAAILANARRTPQLVATLLAGMTQEHERSAGGWHAEWEVLADLMKLTAGAVAHSLDLLRHLEVDADRMRRNLELTGGLIYAETVSLALAEKLGKAEAHARVEQACQRAVAEGKHLKDILREMEPDLPDLEALFEPEQSAGESQRLINEILGRKEGRDRTIDNGH